MIDETETPVLHRFPDTQCATFVDSDQRTPALLSIRQLGVVLPSPFALSSSKGTGAACVGLKFGRLGRMRAVTKQSTRENERIRHRPTIGRLEPHVFGRVFNRSNRTEGRKERTNERAFSSISPFRSCLYRGMSSEFARDTFLSLSSGPKCSMSQQVHAFVHCLRPMRSLRTAHCSGGTR